MEYGGICMLNRSRNRVSYHNYCTLSQWVLQKNKKQNETATAHEIKMNCISPGHGDTRINNYIGAQTAWKFKFFKTKPRQYALITNVPLSFVHDRIIAAKMNQIIQHSSCMLSDSDITYS